MRRLLIDIKNWLQHVLYLLIPRLKRQTIEATGAVKNANPKLKSKGKKLWDGRLGAFHRKTDRKSVG